MTSSTFGCVKSKTLAGMESLNFDNQIISMNKLLASIAALALFAVSSIGDVIVTKSGSKIVGKIQEIDGGKIKISTDFAGDIVVDQTQVEQMTTDDPIFVSIEGGASFSGKITGSDDGSLKVTTEEGRMTTSVSNVKESWQIGSMSPTEKKMRRSWAYLAAFDLAGKNGNKSSTGFGMSFRATLNGPDDRLSFFTRANFEETDGIKSADDARVGVDYSNQINDEWNWYVSSELGRDVIKGTDLFVTTAGGFGYTITKSDSRFLNIRGGVGYRFEEYSDFSTPIREQLNAASLDFGLEHKETLTWGTLVNRIKFTPTIEDFGSFRLYQDTALDLPLKADQYSVRLGFANDYDSDADLSGKKELDTTYYIRLVLNWQ